VGRVLVEPDLSLPGDARVFAIGDIAAVEWAPGTLVPGVAPAANQMGIHAAANIRALVSGVASRPFRYRNMGELATIGKHKAVANFGSGKVTFGGYLAWYLWLFIHIMQLVGFRNRLSVLLQWAYAYIFFERGVRLITESEERTS
jgi:NADH dehydrogenase